MEPVPLREEDNDVDRARVLTKLILDELDDNMLEALDEIKSLLSARGPNDRWAKTWIEIRYAILGLKRFRKAGRRLTAYMRPKRPIFTVGACPHCGRRMR